jgi:hypothetical protein
LQAIGIGNILPDKDKKISIERCRKILNKGERKYSDEEIIKIRDFLYHLGHIAYDEYLNRAQRENQ